MKNISEWVAKHCQGPIIPYSAEYESQIIHSIEEEKEKDAKYVAPAPNPPSSLNKLIKTGYEALHLIHFFTAGEDEVRCWTVRKGAKAPQAAGTIHTDFEKGFISAEVYKYTDFVALGTEQEVKAQGKMRLNGKEYVVEDGDVIFFRFN